MKSPKQFFKNFDFLLFGLTLGICLFGLLMVSSATISYDNPGRYLVTQSAALIIGIVGIYFLMVPDYEYLARLSYFIYGICIILLIAVLIPGIGTGGETTNAQRWIRFSASIGFQPTEIVKIGFIITFAKHLDVVGDEINKPKNVLLLVLHAGILIGLIAIQPDLGSSISFIVIFLVMIFSAKLDYKYFVGAIASLAALAPAAWIWFLEDYQKNRILTFIFPESDPMRAGYQVTQSRIAIGSGQIFGKGLFKGTTQFGFLPERHTDLIYAVIGEELGLVGAVLVLIFLLLIVFRCIYVAANAKNRLGTYIAMGVSAMLIYQIFENIGMCIGLMPVTGITLPFISYGGTSMVINLLAIGLVMNVRYRYKVINF